MTRSFPLGLLVAVVVLALKESDCRGGALAGEAAAAVAGRAVAADCCGLDAGGSPARAVVVVVLVGSALSPTDPATGAIGSILLSPLLE